MGRLVSAVGVALVVLAACASDDGAPGVAPSLGPSAASLPSTSRAGSSANSAVTAAPGTVDGGGDALAELAQLVGHRWVVVAVDGEPWTQTAVPYVEFATVGHFLSGFDGCNTYGADTGEIVDGVVQTSTLVSTDLACEGAAWWPRIASHDRIELDPDGSAAAVDGYAHTLRIEARPQP